MKTMLNHPMPLDEQLCYSLYSASIAMNRAYKPMLDGLGITYPQYLVLHALWEENERTIGAIADRLGLESSTITPLAKRLAVAGLVTRARDPGDERQVRVALTSSGAALRTQGSCLAEAIFAKTGLALGEMRILIRQLQELTDALGSAPSNRAQVSI